MKTLFEILTLRRPHGGKNERHVAEGIIAGKLDGLEVFQAEGKNGESLPMAYVYTTDPKAKTLFCAHLDTVHHDEKTPNPVIYDEVKKQAFKVDNTCLGADCGAGVWITMKMAEARVPGTYVWTLGEEKGGVGAKWLADNAEQFLEQFDRAIAFDRQGTDSVITHQGWDGRCCSDEFAEALARELSTTLPFAPDPTGVYTDTAEWTTIIPECTNLSIGYHAQHTGNETLDVAFLEALLAQCLLIEWESLPTRRDPAVIESQGYGKYGSYWKSSSVDSIAFDDLYGMTEDEIKKLVWEEPDLIGEMLFRAANDEPFVEESDWHMPEWMKY